MPQPPLFDRKVILGLMLILTIDMLSGWYTVSTFRRLNLESSRVMDVHADALIQAERLRYLTEATISNSRGYLQTGDRAHFLRDVYEARKRFYSVLERMRSPSARMPPLPLLSHIEALQAKYDRDMDHAFLQRAKGKDPGVIIRTLQPRTSRVRAELNIALDDLVRFESRQLEMAKTLSGAIERRTIRTLILVAALSLVLILVLAILIVRLVRAANRLYERTLLAVRSRDDILATVSHDLKNPLSAIFLNAQMLRSIHPKSAEIIGKAAASMKTLIQNILDQAKLEAGHMVIEREQHPVAAIFGDVRSLFGPLATQKAIRLEIEEPSPELRILCDRARIEQVLSNLLGNAIKFTPKGGKVRLTAHEENGSVLISVSDTGPGIPPERLPHLFDRYWQAKETARQGTGIGLAIVKGLVEAHSGSVWAETRPGTGTTFHVRLPTQGDLVSPPRPESHGPQSTEEKGRFAS